MTCNGNKEMWLEVKERRWIWKISEVETIDYGNLNDVKKWVVKDM